MTNAKSDTRRIFSKVLELAGYVILIILWVFLLLAELGLMNALDDQALRLGVLTGLLAFLFYFDSRISRNEDIYRKFIAGTEKIREDVADLKSGVIRTGTIGNLIETAMPASNHVEELRVFALNTDKIFEAFRSHPKQYRAGKLLLLLQSSESSKKNHKLWQDLASERIGKVDCVFYETIPSSYFVIFDSECMILGGYYPALIPSGAYYILPFLIRDREVIDSYINLHENTMRFHRTGEDDD